MTEPPKILLVEDDPNLGEVLSSFLEMNEFDVTLAKDGKIGYELFEKDKYDLCLLDVMMPKKDGFSLAKDIRADDENIPIMFLTAKAMKEDVLEGFKSGADDYITKPFNTPELIYRIQAILKRSRGKAKKEDVKEFQIGSFHFNYPFRILTNGDKKDKLSPKEAELLKMFCVYMNDILPRSEALKKIWKEDNYFTARSMDVFVTRLRHYLKSDENIKIVNIHGNGFRLVVNSTDAST